MKKTIFAILICGVMVLEITGCKNKTTDEYIKDKIDIDISFCTIEDEQDTPGGFHGDGDYVVKANCQEEQQKILSQLNGWNEFPLSENIQLIMYGGERDDVTYSYNLAQKANIPKIDNGYYYFLNRHSDAVNEHSDDIFDKYSFNFTLVLFDTDNSMFYYYEFDT